MANVDPTRTALLVMDYQRGILEAIEDPDALLERVQRALDVARRHGLHVGYVRVAFTPDEYAAIPGSNKGFAAAKSAGRNLSYDSPATAIHERVAPRAGDIVVRKSRVGAFSTTDLETQLRGHGVQTLILAGISTSGVVLSTIRDAADRDYRLFVLADACADPDPAIHDALMTKVFPRQADVIATDDLEGLFPA